MVENVDAGRQRVFPALTGLRFFAATAVLLFHFGAGFLERVHAPALAVNFVRNGFLGVSLFFVLSGFILAHTYYRMPLRPAALADFGVARLARLYPVYALALIVALPVLIQPLTPAAAASVLVMLQSWTSPLSGSGYAWVTQAWTLSVELFFYLAFPFVIAGMRRLPFWAVVAVTTAAAALMVGFGLPSITPSARPEQLTPLMAHLPLPLLRTGEFVYGVGLYRLARDRPRLVSRFAHPLAEAAVVVAALAALALARDDHARAVFSVVIGLLIVQLTQARGLAGRVLSTPLMTLLGGASYALYLLQGPVRALCARLVRAPLDQFASPLLTLAAAILVFMVWEQPSRRLILSAWRRATRRPGRPGHDAAPL